MNKACKSCAQQFIIDEADKRYYETIKIPEPTRCPDCRQQRRLSWRNERTLHRRTCDATGKSILSVFSPDAPFPVYENTYWYSDKWNAMDYGQDIDFNKPFFEQFKTLMNKVPQLALSAIANQNCNFVNQCGWCKNCYLIFEADFDEYCFYSNNIYESRFTMDCMTVTNCELCYECIDCHDCYNLKFSQNSENCSDSWFLKNCIGCRNCYGCVNLRNKEYHFLNQKYSKEEYEKRLAELSLRTSADLDKARTNFTQFAKKYPQRFMQGVQNEDSTGNYISNTQRCRDCYDVHNSQDCRYVYNSRHMKMCYDITVFGSREGSEFCYETHETGSGTRNIFFSDQVWEGCYEIYYSKLCVSNSHDLFGCVGLKHAEYCILNKQYSPQQYAELKMKLIEHMTKTGEWGEFFPAEMSPFSYDETAAQDYYPLTKNQTSEKSPQKKDSEILSCIECGKNYKIDPEELKLYKRHDLPIPEKCPDCRHRTRFNLRNPRKLHNRNCDKCAAPLITTFAPEREEQIYCEKCFQDSMD